MLRPAQIFPLAEDPHICKQRPRSPSLRIHFLSKPFLGPGCLARILTLNGGLLYLWKTKLGE